jgi:hypothetical protein
MSSGLAPDGSFRVEVLPGTYTIKASDRSGRISPPLTRDVHASVDNLELTLGQGYEISGRIVVDGPGHLDFPKVTLHFFGDPAKIDSAGTFHANAGNHEAGYMIQGLPEDWYVKDFKVAGRVIPGRKFQLEPGVTEVVLTLSPLGARVEMAAAGANGADDVLSAVMFALLPETGVVDVESMLIFERGADPSGKLIRRGVPPGDYRVFSLDASNWALLFDPETLLNKYRNLAPLVKIVEGERKRITVRPTKIPVE